MFTLVSAVPLPNANKKGRTHTMPNHSLTATVPAPSALALDICAGLLKSGQKEIPSKYLYDSVGSALFEVICHLPEYGVTRAEERLLRLHATEIVDQLPRPVVV